MATTPWPPAAQMEISPRPLPFACSVFASVGTIRAPVLLQWCERDTVIAQGAEASVRRFANTHVDLVRYPNVGHWPMWEIPDRFAQDIKTFLDRTVPAH